MVSLVKLGKGAREPWHLSSVFPEAARWRSRAVWYAFGAERADVQPRGGFAFAFGDEVARWKVAHPDAQSLPAGINGAYVEMLCHGRLVTVEGGERCGRNSATQEL